MTSSASKGLTSGLALLTLGIALTAAARTLDGWARGLSQGGGIVLLLISVVLMSNQWRKGGEAGDGMWLPSRDHGADNEDPR